MHEPCHFFSPTTLAPGAFPMLDEIRRHCAFLLSEDFVTHTAAYLWLRDCQPFGNVLYRLRQHDLSLFEVAGVLATNSRQPLTPTALALLEEEVGRQANGRRQSGCGAS